jgi:HlyD family secretion protein
MPPIPAMPTSRWIMIGAAVVFVGALLASGALSSSEAELTAATMTVTRRDFQVTHVEAGEIRAAKDEKIVAPRVRGQLKITHLYPEGARVEVGDLILQFDREQHAQEVKDNAGRLEQAKEDMRKTLAQQSRKRAALVMQVEQQTASRDLARISLTKSEFGSPVEREEAKIKVENAVRALTQAETNVEAQEIIDRVELANRELRIAHRQKNYDRSLSDYERLSVHATQPGIIVYEKIRKRGTDRQGKVTEGDVVWGGTSLLALPELDSMQVYTQVGEMDVQRVKPGQTAMIRLEAYPGPVFAGVVRDVSPMANELEYAPNVQVFDMVVDIIEQDERLYPGMSASVQVVIDAVPDALAIPLSSLFRRDDRTFVYRKTKGGFEAIDVTPGPDNGLDVIIEEGLSEGDTISLSDLGLL